MSARLSTGGRLIDRTKPLEFLWNNKLLRGFAGDTLASALLANGEMLVGRSFKYHRPRGIVASGVEEPNALVALGQGRRFEPNARATTTELHQGLTARSQNHWPSLAFDLGAAAAYLSPLLPAGFYYKTFMAPRAAWKHLFEPAIRRSAGLGTPPDRPDADHYEHLYVHTDILVVGGGTAGLAAARAAAGSGAQVLVLEQSPHWGGRAAVDGTRIDDQPATDWIAAQLAALDAMPNVTRRARTAASGVYDHGYVLAEERPHDGPEPHLEALPRRRLWRIRARRIILATGAIERPLAFANNDRPGVMLASAVRDYLGNWAVGPGDRTVLVTTNDDAYRTAIALTDAGLAVPAILDTRPDASGPLPQAARERGIRILEGHAIANVRGRARVAGVAVALQPGEGSIVEEVACDAVAMSGGWSPAVHLWSHCGGKLVWDEARAFFSPDPTRPPRGPDGAGVVITAGSASGALEPDACLSNAYQAGRQAAEEVGRRPGDGAAPRSDGEAEAPSAAVWSMPAAAAPGLRAKAFVDFQNDVKVSDIRLAAREGYVSVEHAKRYTTLGMATDQGKLSNVNGLAVLADARATAIPDVGTTTFRPPWTPVTFGTLAGEARGPLFKATRRTPMDAWHEAAGAVWEPVGDWRRPFAYPRPGETTPEAVAREVLAARQDAGLFDASTLGKILVKGLEAGRFLDLLYTNVMSSLPVGRCRYGLMCNENGFLFDDGVVVRLTEDSFLCHTTTGGADRVHGWMEEWLQTEWWDFKAWTANLTEQFAQIGVAGPAARRVLEAAGTSADISREGLPSMHWTPGTVAGIPARIHRISFTGELSYEIAVSADRGQALWDVLREAGVPFGLQPYGTEAMHVMRAEKGFIIVGDESDGTVTPQDLGLGWAVSKKKADFIGKRAQERPELTRAGRKQLVGLATLDAATVLPDGAHAVSGPVRTGEPTPTIGHVTSAYFSPTLGRSIAMALIDGGASRLGEVLDFPLENGTTIRATVVDPVFLDGEGARQDA